MVLGLSAAASAHTSFAVSGYVQGCTDGAERLRVVAAAESLPACLFSGAVHSCVSPCSPRADTSETCKEDGRLTGWTSRWTVSIRPSAFGSRSWSRSCLQTLRVHKCLWIALDIGVCILAAIRLQVVPLPESSHLRVIEPDAELEQGEILILPVGIIPQLPYELVGLSSRAGVRHQVAPRHPYVYS